MSDVAPPPPPEAPAPDPIPWEQTGLPWTTALVETIKGVVTAPTPTLARLPVNGDFLKPLLYAILLGWIGSWAEFLWSSVTDQFTAGLMGGGSEELTPAFWDVSDLEGKEVTLQIVDTATGGWGHINIDHIETLFMLT